MQTYLRSLIKSSTILLGYSVELGIHTVTTPPMVGPTWPRVRSSLGSDCLPALSQGTFSIYLFMDLFDRTLAFCARMFDVRCPVILGLY